jgi:hypothetical protein
MLQQLVQTLSTTTMARRDPGDDDECSWLCSSFDLHCGLTVVELADERLPTGGADSPSTSIPGGHTPTQA